MTAPLILYAGLAALSAAALRGPAPAGALAAIGRGAARGLALAGAVLFVLELVVAR